MSDLETLFDRWERTYPEHTRAGFHRDGIIDDDHYRTQQERILFVLLEPNSKGGNYDRFYGEDLRKVFRIPLRKEINQNLGLWTRFLLDGETSFERLEPDIAQKSIGRVAVMNLKKMAGSGKADYVAVGQHAWSDRGFILKELEIIDPTLIVTCGAQANRILGQILEGDLGVVPPEDAEWLSRGYTVLPANHPSLRPRFAKDAMNRLIERHRGVGPAPQQAVEREPAGAPRRPDIGEASCSGQSVNESKSSLEGTRLDPLFERWVSTYSVVDQTGFHRDGAVDEAAYWIEQHRVLFIMTEPNSKGGAYDHYWGWDLRVVLGQETLAKEFNINLGLWAQALLDGEVAHYRPTPAMAQSQIRRIAVINLKKVGGDGKASLDEIVAVAKRDRSFILEQISELDPHLIVTCGPKANRAFGYVSTGEYSARVPDKASWLHDDVTVLPGNSPSLRPYQGPRCFERLMGLARANKVAAFE